MTYSHQIMVISKPVKVLWENVSNVTGLFLDKLRLIKYI